jgi:hypothetical protein
VKKKNLWLPVLEKGIKEEGRGVLEGNFKSNIS